MSLMDHRFIKVYLLPAAAFQSVIIGAGYGTGREVMEYISRHGPIEGMGAALVIALAFGSILAVTFEFARKIAAYDYRAFFKALLGRYWFLFELLFITSMVVTLAVIGAAAGIVLHDSLGVIPSLGVPLTLVVVILANTAGRRFVNRFLTSWALVFMAVLLAYLAIVIVTKGPVIFDAFSADSAGLQSFEWLKTGLQFAMFNVAVAPALLYTVRDHKSRRDAVASGFFAGFFGVLPAIAFHLTFMSAFPAIIDEALPVYTVIAGLGIPFLLGAYGIALCGTIIQTGVGMLQGVNERLDSWLIEKNGVGLSRISRAGIAGFAVVASLLLAQLGIVTLVAKGYSLLSLGFMLVFVLPVMTVGLWRCIKLK
jgi:uncharacterized membrane protein YkvI